MSSEGIQPRTPDEEKERIKKVRRRIENWLRKEATPMEIIDLALQLGIKVD